MSARNISALLALLHRLPPCVIDEAVESADALVRQGWTWSRAAYAAATTAMQGTGAAKAPEIPDEGWRNLARRCLDGHLLLAASEQRFCAALLSLDEVEAWHIWILRGIAESRLRIVSGDWL